MKLLDYIRGLRKGKEAHRLERESMQDPFLADAIDGYSLVEGNHEQRIEKLRMQVSTHSAKKKKARAITWSIAACLVIGFGISSYFLFLKKSMTDEVFIAEESAPAKLPEATTPATPTNPATPAASVTPRKEIALAATKVKTDSAPISEIAMKQAGKKDMIAQIQTAPQPQGAPVAAVPMMEGNIIQGKVTDEKGEPIIGASVAYKGTNIGTTTNTNGEFSLVKKEGEKRLTAQFIGYDPVEVPVDTSQTILIAMNENKQALNEVVVVGYGTKKEITPQPVIGKRKYQKYLKKNLIRPTDDSCKDIKGKIVLSFFVDQEGTPQNITVIHGLCESADKEAIRLVKEGPKWTIGKNPARITVRF